MILALFESLLEIFVNSLDGTSLTMCLLFLTELQYVSRLLFKKAMLILPIEIILSTHSTNFSLLWSLLFCPI